MSGRSRKPQRHGKLFTIATPTSQGEFLACYSGRGLCALWFPGRRADTVEPNANGRAPAEIRGWHKLTVKALDDCLAGRTPNGLPPLDLSVGTEVQQEVWRALVRIGLGATMSYREVALAI